MATVVTVMDRPGFDQRTDNIVLVQPRRRRLLWVPRDVWCPEIDDRINGAFCVGGHDALRAGLASLGLPVEHSVCLPRSAVEHALEGAAVTVPVEEPIALWYPLAPQLRLEDGRRPVDFTPPSEELRGERIHQWLGARQGRDPARPTSDLHRIRRQQVFVRAALQQGLDVSAALRGPDEVSLSDPAALDELRRVRPWWRLATTGQVEDRVVDDRQVLILRSPHPHPPLPRRVAARLRRPRR